MFKQLLWWWIDDAWKRWTHFKHTAADIMLDADQRLVKVEAFRRNWNWSEVIIKAMKAFVCDLSRRVRRFCPNEHY